MDIRPHMRVDGASMDSMQVDNAMLLVAPPLMAQEHAPPNDPLGDLPSTPLDNPCVNRINQHIRLHKCFLGLPPDYPP